jgi:hypothetical protein
MDVRTILWLVGLVLCVLGVAEIPSLVMALALNEPWLPFALSIALGLSVGGLLVLPARGTELTLNHRSAFLAVTPSSASRRSTPSSSPHRGSRQRDRPFSPGWTSCRGRSCSGGA